MNLFSRSNAGTLSRWFWTVDRLLLLLLLLLIAVGLVLMLGASPPQVKRLLFNHKHLHMAPMHFFIQQFIFAGLGILVMMGTSFASRITVRRLAVIGLLATLLALVVTHFIGVDVKGARRWINFAGIALQPSEFLKPFLAVTTAWILASRYDDPSAPAFSVSLAITLLAVLLLVSQPDYGQTFLVLMIWLAEALMAGLPLLIVGGFICVALAGLVVAYFTVAHVEQRISHFAAMLHLLPADAAEQARAIHGQVETALIAIRSGGLWGVGPAAGSIKWRIPDAHTDYIFAVAAEEYGLIACSALALLYLAIILRVTRQQLVEHDPFVFLATTGLAVQFGCQAFINMGVSVALLPSKGMTLPFVSYGGSSMLAMSLTMGMVLAFTRRNRFLRPGVWRRPVSSHGWSGFGRAVTDGMPRP